MPKLGYVSGLYCIEDFFNCLAPELFVAYHYKVIHYRPSCPSRHADMAIQISMVYKSINVDVTRIHIEPKAAWLHYGEFRDICSVALNVQVLSFPILLKYYMDKKGKLYIRHCFGPLWVLAAYKKDWVAELANQPGQELLKQMIYKNSTNDKRNQAYYNCLDPASANSRKAFYQVWKKRKEKDKRTDLFCINSLFNINRRIGFELTLLGIGYETNAVLIFHWDILSFYLIPSQGGVFSFLFSIGYNFNRLWDYDTHRNKHKTGLYIKKL